MSKEFLTTPLDKRKILPVKPAFAEILIKLAKKNKNIVVLDADLQRCSGTRPFMERFPNRHFQLAISEQNMISIAAGLALVGKIPFANTFANFLTKRACDQVSISVAFNRANVKLCGDYAGMTTAKNGGSHCSVEDIAIMRSMPNMVVLVPADTIELQKAIKAAVKYKGPVYIRKVKGTMPQIFTRDYRFKIGRSVELMKGNDLTIISCGIMTYYALIAGEKLKKRKINARVINMSTIKPIDKRAILKAAKETKGIITIENHSIYGGLGSAVSEVIGETCPCLVKKIGIPDKFGETATFKWQLEYFKITSERIVQLAQKILRK